MPEGFFHVDGLRIEAVFPSDRGYVVIFMSGAKHEVSKTIGESILDALVKRPK